MLVSMQAFFGVQPGSGIVALPLFIALAALTAFALGLWLSALNVQYRDVRFTVPFFIQLWLIATPIAYPASLIPEKWRLLYGLNPMAGVVEGFRWSILGHGERPTALLAVSVLVVVCLVIGGMYYFRRMEQQFVDVV
jgi:lipopolysaccharide transport system permease protein